jgi:cyanophycinase
MAKTRRSRKASHDVPAVPPLHAVPRSPRGSLMIIGGNENKDGHRSILEAVARHVGSGTLVLATLATEHPERQFEEYARVFKELGVKRIQQMDARRRQDLLTDELRSLLDGARAVFFGGGDQLKITSRLGGTQLCESVRELYQRGAMIAGTSSGASVMSETMLVAGDGGTSSGAETLRMAPGLGFMPGVIIDQHFAERGRIGRLVSAVAQNPRLLGIGIDEDTAAVFDGHERLRVIGSGAVYVVDGRALTYTNAAEDAAVAVSVHGIQLHVLSPGDTFGLDSREARPGQRPPPPANSGSPSASP